MTPAPASAAELPPESAGVRVVFTQLQIALHTLVAALLVLTVIGAHSGTTGRAPGGAAGSLNLPAVTTAAGLAAVYCLGTVWERRREATRTIRLGWLGVVVGLWAALVVQVPEAAYLVFPLFFLAQFLLGVWAGAAAVALLAVVAVLALGLHGSFTAAGIIGPAVGALVALGLGAGVRALHRESQARRAVIAELMNTRSELAAREREVGREAERARLAGEIHDTVAQGLSSIGMLLHAAERTDPTHPAVEQLRLARQVAGENLTETRRLIAALRPTPLDGVTLAGALRRIAERVGTENPGIAVSVDGDLTDDPPAELSAVLVRVTQALTNAVRHGAPDSIRVALHHRPGAITLEVSDDGGGFDAAAPRTAASFGLDGMARRVDDLGGTLEVESKVGVGTTVRAVLPTGTAEKEL